MLRLSIPWIVGIVEKLKQLDSVVAGQPLDNSIFFIMDAGFTLPSVFDESIYTSHIRSSRAAWQELKAVLDFHINRFPAEGSVELGQHEVFNIKNKRDQLYTIFTAELNIMPSFLVMGKGGYDVNTLIDQGIILFPQSMLAKVPTSEADAKEAGKALAFELPTACEFHVFRVVESVLRVYWDKISNSTPRPTLETIGNIANELEGIDSETPKCGNLSSKWRSYTETL